MKALFSVISTIIVLFNVTSSSASERIRLATTTSVENSGLLYKLLDLHKENKGIQVDVVSAGTGYALAIGRNGDADVVLVHAPELEKEFVRKGYGVARKPFMYNYFIIVGPKDDPAKIRSASSAVEAFKKIRNSRSHFVSRGDNSGTHTREKKLWKLAEIEPGGSSYIQTGQGMGATLMVADEKNAYCLVDKGTYTFYKNKVLLVPLFVEDQNLLNTYSAIVVNPEKHSDVRYHQARDLVSWLNSDQAQDLIGHYSVNGDRLFTPLRGAVKHDVHN